MKPSIIALSGAACFLALAGVNWALGSSEATPAPAAGCCGDPSADSPPVGVKHSVTLDGAHRVLQAAIAKARERNAGGAIAVVDESGHLVAFARLDGTFGAGAAVSIGKARTAATFKKPTKAFEDAINNGRTALAAVSEMIPLQGGVPIVHDGFVIGAVGVSGAHSQVEDEEIALAGAAAIASPAGAGH
jgi:glc operon protein GlcG